MAESKFNLNSSSLKSIFSNDFEEIIIRIGAK